jgi:RNA polymerase sigma factor (sigma-70 family)
MRQTDNDGFVTMIKKYKRIIYKVINTYCNDVDDKKDLEQEIIIQLWKSYQSYNGSTQLSTWIYRIAMNVSISFYRNNVTRKTNTTSINDSIFQELASNAINEEETDQRRLLYGFISQLDEFNREVFMLYLDDYSYKEIAEIVGITESNVGTKINRIKHKIHEYFLTLTKKADGIR